MSYESELKMLSQRAGSVVFPVCWESEGNHLLWLATTGESANHPKVLTRKIQAQDPQVPSKNILYDAKVITKNYRKTTHTSLVLRCERNQSWKDLSLAILRAE